MELTSRLSKNAEGLLNIRIQGEFQSAHIYEAMSNWCDCYGFYKAKDKFREYADEELKHQRKLADYIIDRNGIAKIPTVVEVPVEYASLLDVLNKAYVHELTITSGYRNLLRVVREEGDEVTFSELEWFIKEQIEEESKFADCIILANRLGLTDDCKGIEWFKLEDQLAS